MATPRTSVIIKRLRQRFGVRAPRMAIRTHIAWYWRGLSLIFILLILLALGRWIYDEGRRTAGFNLDESSREVQALRNHLMALDEELTKLRSLAGTGESSLQIERAALNKLAQQARVLEQENAALKEDLAFFEGIMPTLGPSEESHLRIDLLRVEQRNMPNEYRYRALIINGGGKQNKEFKGSFQIVLKVQQQGKDAIINIPPSGAADKSKYILEIKRFNILEGEFTIPAGAHLKNVEVQLLQNNVVRVKQSVTP